MIPRLEDVRAAVGTAIEDALADLPPGDLADAMRYACVGGKRIRAFLVLESARLHGLADARVMPVAVAVELLHAYSLVHDDLPALDNDDLRRGMPTCHIQWSQATAILAGDALQTRAFEMLTHDAIGDPAVRLDLIGRFAEAVGARGMVWGQAQDIAAETAIEPLELSAVKALQQAKTGALIRFAASSGAVVAGADPAALTEYAAHLGLAFQIADDILDVTGDPEQTGKRVGKDARQGKATFVSLLGLEGARDKAAAIVQKAEDALNSYPDSDPAGNLRQLARFIIHRQT